LESLGEKNEKSSFKKYALISKNQYIKCGIYEKEMQKRGGKKNEKKEGAKEMEKREKE
jgi:hypothetical protein